jgi:hypothetical protein
LSCLRGTVRLPCSPARSMADMLCRQGGMLPIWYPCPVRVSRRASWCRRCRDSGDAAASRTGSRGDRTHLIDP